MPQNEPTPGDISNVSDVLLPMSQVRLLIKEALQEMASQAMRPAVIASDSGVNCVTRETMSSGVPKITVKVYHENPDVADRECARLFERATAYAANHAPGQPYP